MFASMLALTYVVISTYFSAMNPGRESNGVNPLIVIFACIHNAGRSQMAASLFNKFAHPAKARALSAGTDPASQIHHEVLKVMTELDIDLSKAKPTFLTEELIRTASLLVTMGCGEKCPFVPDIQKIDWQLEDPKGKNIETVRAIRDDIHRRILILISENNWA